MRTAVLKRNPRQCKRWVASVNSKLVAKEFESAQLQSDLDVARAKATDLQTQLTSSDNELKRLRALSEPEVMEVDDKDNEDLQKHVQKIQEMRRENGRKTR